MGMCGGGSSGSDAQAQEQQRIRAEQDAAISKLNALFGVGDPSASIKYVPKTGPRYSVTPDGHLQSNGLCAARQAANGALKANPNATYYDDQAAYQRALDAKQAELDATKAQHEANYQTAGEDILNFKQPQLDKQRDQADRLLRFQLARTGQVGGSLALDQGRELTDNYQRGVADLTNQEQAAVNNMRAGDEQTRIDLINRIRSGMDQASALASAESQAKSNIAQARDSALAQNLQDYFSGMGYLYGQNQQQKAYDAKLAQLGYGSAPKAYNGSLSGT